MKKHIVWLLISIGLLCSVGVGFAAQDVMEVMFAPAKAHENIVDLWADKQAVGDEVFRSSIQIWSTTTTQAPLLVRITKFLLRMVVVLSVTMVLYNGVLWIVESAKGGDVKDAKNNLIYIFVGILLALLSVTLINLVSSFWISSLNPSSVL